MKKAPFKLSKMNLKNMNVILQFALLVVTISTTILYTMNGFDGYLVIVNALVATVAAIVVEILFKLSSKEKINIIDMLFKEAVLVIPLTITLLFPLHAPVYVVAVSTIIGTWIGKLVYGGFGNNIFNASAVGVLFGHISFKTQLAIPANLTYALTEVKNATAIQNIAFLHQQPLFLGFSDYYFYSVGAVSGLILVIVLVVMALLKVIDYRLSLTYILTVFGITFIMGGSYFAFENIITGSVIFATCFLITEAHTSPTTREGKIVFAAVAGLITVMIRAFGSNLEGVLYAILLANLITPYINRTQKRSGNVALIKALVFLLVVIVLGGLLMGSINAPQLEAFSGGIT